MPASFTALLASINRFYLASPAASREGEGQLGLRDGLQFRQPIAQICSGQNPSLGAPASRRALRRCARRQRCRRSQRRESQRLLSNESHLCEGFDDVIYLCYKLCRVINSFGSLRYTAELHVSPPGIVAPLRLLAFVKTLCAWLAEGLPGSLQSFSCI